MHMPMMEAPPVVRYTIDEAASALAVHRNTIYSRLKRGLLACEYEKVNGRRRTYIILTPEDLAQAAHGADNGMESDIAAPGAEEWKDVGMETAILRERCSGLEQLVATLREQLDLERARNAQLYDDVRAGRLALPAPRRRRWWHLTWR